MAEPVKRGDKYRHTVMVNGQRFSKTFLTKKDARQWEADMRTTAIRGSPGELHGFRRKHTLVSACDKYVQSISKMKRDGADVWEAARFNALIRFFPGMNLEDMTTEDVGRWRDSMLGKIKSDSINRYMALHSNLFYVAAKEWGWVTANPFSAVRWPDPDAPRNAVWKWQQIRRVLREGQRRGGKIGETVKAFHIALGTSLRLKEALVATALYNPNNLTITLESSKMSKTREVIPTDTRGRRILAKYRSQVLGVGPKEASVLFSQLMDQMLITGLQFRDSRATALTLMARRFDILTLARISRHRNMEMLRKTYYRETPEDISRRL